MNPFRQMLRTAGGKPPIGTWISSASPIVAEAVGHAGFDWGVVDMEHAPLDLMGVVHMLQALGNTKMLAVVRLPWNDAVVVKRLLDAGATTLLFPFVQNADEARRAVAATRYPPAGMRGMSGASRASKFGTTPNYARVADAGIGVIVQLETPQALTQIEAIAAVDGVDAIFIGPADLSASMGHRGNPAHPEMQAIMEDATRRIVRAGKAAGNLSPDAATAQRYLEWGATFVAVGLDTNVLARETSALAQKFAAG